MRTVIVADGGNRTGLGHWIRCMALSEFLPQPQLYVPVDHACLNTAPLPVVVSWRTFPEADLAIVDTYHRRERIINELRSKCRHICAITDESYTNFQLDWIVSPHVGSDTLAYHIPGKVLAGAKYALVRPVLRTLRRQRQGKVRRLLVCLGGGIAANVVIPELAHAVRSATLHTGIEVYIYGGTLDTLPQFGAHRRVKSSYYDRLPEAVYGADLAITPASMTMLELLCCGVPCLTYALNDHQRWIQAHSPTVPFDVSSLIELINDEPRRIELSQRGLDTVDGLGCQRVANAIPSRM